MSLLATIQEPTLLLDEQKTRGHIRAMVGKALRNKVRLRPHFKTHQSREVGEWYREEGVDCITVSSLKMASYFAAHGWKDITVAFPANVLEMDRINRLASRVKLNLLVTSIAAVKALAAGLEHTVDIWIKVDTGYQRTGLLPGDRGTMEAILHLLEESERMAFAGFLAHAGHSYHSRNHAEILAVHRESVAVLTQLGAEYALRYPQLELSVGDTPTCSIAVDFSGVDEIRPGNFVFYDLTQAKISSCGKEDISVVMACPVVSKEAERNEIILYGGGVHFSKDLLERDSGGRSYGELVWMGKDGWSAPVEGCYLSKLSQEHGTLKVTDEVFKRILVGDVVCILPVHSCMAAAAMRGYTTLTGERLEYLDTLKDYSL